MKVNIGTGNSNDDNYRYKRDVIVITKVNKQIWKIDNMNEIARQLKVGKPFIEKFYAEIKKRGLAMVGAGSFRGTIATPELEKILNSLIDKYLLCPRCKLPEWDGSVCKACGEMKATKFKLEPEKKDNSCPHVSQACKYANELYEKRSAMDVTDSERAELEKILDYFWDIPICDADSIPPEKCKKLYTSFCKRYEEAFDLVAPEN